MTKQCLDVAMFEAHIESAPGGCWLWTKSINTRTGYGQIKVSGCLLQVHPWSYRFHVGEIPEGLVLDHLCRVRACVNPYHLEPVTHRVNILRGEGPAAVNARKIRCVRGHPLTGSNLYVAPGSGKRACRICRADADRRARAA